MSKLILLYDFLLETNKKPKQGMRRFDLCLPLCHLQSISDAWRGLAWHPFSTRLLLLFLFFHPVLVSPLSFFHIFLWILFAAGWEHQFSWSSYYHLKFWRDGIRSRELRIHSWYLFCKVFLCLRSLDLKKSRRKWECDVNSSVHLLSIFWN